VPKKVTQDSTSATAITAYGDATAIGSDTYTSASVTTDLVDHKHVTQAKGEITALAAADAHDETMALASAYTDLAVSGADKVIIKTIRESGHSDGGEYDYVATQFHVIDNDHKDGSTKVILHEKDIVDTDIALSLDGNLAQVDFDVQAHASDSYVAVDAFALTLEDQLSISRLMATAAG